MSKCTFALTGRAHCQRQVAFLNFENRPSPGLLKLSTHTHTLGLPPCVKVLQYEYIIHAELCYVVNQTRSCGMIVASACLLANFVWRFSSVPMSLLHPMSVTCRV